MIKHIVAITLVSFICCFQQHVDSRILKNIPPIRDHRQILAHAKMHSRNRRNDPSFKVEYHHGKDEHGNILQKPKIKKDPPPIEVEARILHKKRMHVARRALEYAIMRKLPFGEQMQAAWDASLKLLKDPRHEGTIRRLTQHFKTTGRRLQNFVGSMEEPEQKQIGISIVAMGTKFLRNRRHLNTGGGGDICNVSPNGHPGTWMKRELCVDKRWSEWEGERDGYQIKGRNLCQECGNPGQLCHLAEGCSDTLMNCVGVDKSRAERNFQTAKLITPNLFDDLAPELQKHPCLNNFCPALKNAVDRNSKCAESVYQYCCDPSLPDCSLEPNPNPGCTAEQTDANGNANSNFVEGCMFEGKPTECTSSGCTTVLDSEWRDMNWLVSEIMTAEGKQFNNDEEKWMYFETLYEKQFICPFKNEGLCNDENFRHDGPTPPAESNGLNQCARIDRRRTESGEEFEVHDMWRDLGEVPRLATSLNAPCWHGFCFNKAILNFCAWEPPPNEPNRMRPPYRPANGAPTAAQVFELMFTGETPIDKVANTWQDAADFEAPGCKIGCKDVLEFIQKKSQESMEGNAKSGVNPLDINFPESLRNTVTVCESVWEAATGENGGMDQRESNSKCGRKLEEEEEGDNNGEDGGGEEGGEDGQEGGEDGQEGGEQVQDTSHEFRQCVYSQCSACFPVDPETGRSKTTNQMTNDIEYLIFTGNGIDAEREECAFDVMTYCKSDEGKTDPACIGSPCKNLMKGNKTLCDTEPGLNEYFALPLCEKAACIEYQNDLVTLYGSKGYYQPGDSWKEGYLRMQNAILYAPNKEPTIDFSLSSEEIARLEPSADTCGENKEIIEGYVKALVIYCNLPGNGHASVCRDFSKCGDGVVTWGEECDPGPDSDPSYDGCQRCQHLKQGFACSEPGTTCGRCDLDTRILRQSADAHKACPFCLNRKLEGKSSDIDTPCNFDKCKSIKTEEDAVSCDSYVYTYCGALENLGMSDPGCVGYTNQSLMFAVPRVSNNCTYKFHEIVLNSETIDDENGRRGGLIKEKIAILDCEFVDITGYNKDTTPLFWHISLTKPPMKHMYDKIDDQNLVTYFNDLEKNLGPGGLVDMRDITFEHFYEFQDTSLTKDNNMVKQLISGFDEGRNMPFFGALYVDSPTENWNLPVFKPDPCQDPYQEEDRKRNGNYQKSCMINEQSMHDNFKPEKGLRIIPLPPCEDATMWAVKAKALEYKFRGVNSNMHVDERFNYGVDQAPNGNHLDKHSMYKGLADLDPEQFKPSCIPRKNHFVGMFTVSRTVDGRMCHGENCPPHPQEGASAQKVTFNSYIPVPARSDGKCQHIDSWCCNECYDDNGNENNKCSNNGHGGHCLGTEHNGDSKGECCRHAKENPPTTVEDALKSGKARFLFGNRLYQKGCTDENCEFKVEHCKVAEVSEAILEPNMTALDDAVTFMRERIKTLDNKVKSFENLTQAFFEVSAASMSQGYADSKRLFEQMVSVTIEKETVESIDCEHDYWNHTSQSRSTLWENDPCCNWEKRRTQCCLPKQVAGADVTKLGNIDMAFVRSKCRNPDKVRGVLNDLSANIRKGDKCAADLESEVSANALDKLWEFRDTCEKKIGLHGPHQMDLKGACESNADCFCTYSTCDTQNNECIPPYDFMGQCFAQCFESEAPSKLVRFLKRDWNVSVSDPPAKFEKLFMDRMTDETCMGDAVWENIDTIGENRVEWRCNTTCQLHNMCDQHHALEAYANDCEYKCRDSRGDHNCWQNCHAWGNKAVCEGTALKSFIQAVVPTFDTKFYEHLDADGNPQGGHCEPSGVQTPCGCEHCRRPCENKEACEAPENGGTYFTHSENDNWGQCCPKGKHIHEVTDNYQGQSNTRRECKIPKPDTPEGWSVRNEDCCRGQGGTWNGGQMSCCFGELKVECDWKGQCETHCEEWVDTWKPCRDCEKKSCGQELCQDCHDKRMGCCGEVTIYANKTACLMYSQCNDNDLYWRIRNDEESITNGQGERFHESTEYRALRNKAKCGDFNNPGSSTQKTIIYDDSPLCMECHGMHCWTKTQAAKCRVELEGIDGYANKKAACESLSSHHKYVTDHHWASASETNPWGNCYDYSPSIVDATTCLISNSNANTASDVTGNLSPRFYDDTIMGDWQKSEIRRAIGLAESDPVPQPVAYFGHLHVRQGCYVKPFNKSESVTCTEAGAPNGWTQHWSHTEQKHSKCCPPGWHHWDHDSVCYEADTSNSHCSAGIQFNNTLTYEPPRFTTKAECDYGKCSGSLQSTEHFALWSTEQCEQLSAPQCDRWCRKCQATKKYGDSGAGTYNNSDYDSIASGTYTTPTAPSSTGWGNCPIGYWQPKEDKCCKSEPVWYHYDSGSDKCRMTDHKDVNHEFRWSGQGQGGACFDQDLKLITRNKYTENKADCEVLPSHKWYSCVDRNWTQTGCESPSSDFPTTVLNILGCKVGGQEGHDWGQCNTEELCSGQGDCHGHQSHEYGRARYCGPKSPETKTANDECGHQAAATSDNTKCCSWGYKYDSGTGMCNWDLGASHWGRVTVTIKYTTGTSPNTVTTYEQEERHVHCSSAQWESEDGVCVDTDADIATECPNDWEQHAEGCLVDIPWTADNTKQNQTYCSGNGLQWFTRLDTRAKCLSVQGCKEKYMWDYTPKNQAKCSECSGDWEPRFNWNGGSWKSGESLSYRFFPNGRGFEPRNRWTNSFSTSKMRKQLQQPLLKMFAETKKTQTLIKFNYAAKQLRKIACDCGTEARSDCWSGDDTGTLVGVGTSFCGNSGNVIQGGCDPVEVKQSCATGTSRRRLLATGAKSDSSSLSFGHLSAGSFATPICSQTGNENACTCNTADSKSKIETVGSVKNAAGVTIGQVVGDGIDFINDDGAFPDSIEKCLKFRSDINHHRALFNTTDIAKFDGTSFTTLGYGDFGHCSGDCSSISNQQICFKATSGGKYFPILRTHMTQTTDSTACSISNFDTSNGFCMPGTSSKRCKCGFYGTDCKKGCPNSCSEANTVNSRCDANTNVCTCPSTHKGADCSSLNCPEDSEGNTCSNRGICKVIMEGGVSKAKCECNSQYEGTACATTVVIKRSVDGGLDAGDGLNGIQGMAFQFGWNFPAALLAFILWMIILTPCCWVACCFYCPCCCRKQNTCCWAEKWGCGKNKSICACKCCHSYCEAHAVRLGSHAELLKHKYFTKFDTDHDGFLDAMEMKAMVKSRFDAKVTVGQMAGLISRFDTDNDGKLTEAEYQTMLTTLEKEDTDHSKKGLRAILENLPDAGNVKTNQVQPMEMI